MLEGISPSTRQTLLHGLQLHTDRIQYELDREGATMESDILAKAIGNLTAILGTVSPEARAGGAAAKMVAGSSRRMQEARMIQLQKQALTPRLLLIELRAMLIRLPQQ